MSTVLTQLDESRIGEHVTILGWLSIAQGVILLIVGLFLSTILSTVGLVSGDATARGVLGLIGGGLGGFLLLLALPGLAAGYGLLKRRPWARILGIVLGVLNLPGFPIGTAIGLYTLWVLLQETAPAAFGAAPPEPAPAVAPLPVAPPPSEPAPSALPAEPVLPAPPVVLPPSDLPGGSEPMETGPDDRSEQRDQPAEADPDAAPPA